MKNKLFLPVMAMVVAIGMSFATERSIADANSDYVHENGLWIEIPEQTCPGQTAIPCRIEFADNLGEELEVYDAEDFSTLKSGGTTVVPVINRPGS